MAHKEYDAVKRLPKAAFCGGTTDANPALSKVDKALRILRMKQLVERTNLSRATLYVLMSSDPAFPQKIKLTARSIGFLESEVDAWLAARVQACRTVQ